MGVGELACKKEARTMFVVYKQTGHWEGTRRDCCLKWVHSDLWSGLPKDICSSCQDEHRLCYHWQPTLIGICNSSMWKNAFLYGDLEEKIYMEVLPGFGSYLATNQVFKLKKALYGLKQSPRLWFGRFALVMIKLGYRQSQGDHVLFIKHFNSVGVSGFLVYVDDIILTGNNEKER